MNLDLSNKALVRLVKKSGLHAASLQTYLGRKEVLRPENFRSQELYAIRRSRDWVEEAQSCLPGGVSKLDVPGLTGCEILLAGVNGSRMLILSEEGDVLAGKFNFVPYVPPHGRGQGYGKLMAFLSDIYNHEAIVSHYSEEGFHARMGAHALHVSVALRAGFPIMKKLIIQQYRLEDGVAKLKYPWTIEDQNSLEPQLDLSSRMTKASVRSDPDQGFSRPMESGTRMCSSL